MRIKMGGDKKAATMTLISLLRIRVVHGMLHHLSIFGVHLLIQFKLLAMIRTTLHLVEAAINGAIEMELQGELSKKRQARQVVEPVSNVVKKAICLESAQLEEIMLEEAAAELALSVARKAICLENVLLVEAQLEVVEAEPASNAEKKAT